MKSLAVMPFSIFNPFTTRVLVELLCIMEVKTLSGHTETAAKPDHSRNQTSAQALAGTPAWSGFQGLDINKGAG